MQSSILNLTESDIKLSNIDDFITLSLYIAVYSSSWEFITSVDAAEASM